MLRPMAPGGVAPTGVDRFVVCCSPEDRGEVQRSVDLLEAHGESVEVHGAGELDGLSALDLVRKAGPRSIWVIVQTAHLDADEVQRLRSLFELNGVPNGRVLHMATDWSNPLALVERLSQLRASQSGQQDARDTHAGVSTTAESDTTAPDPGRPEPEPPAQAPARAKTIFAAAAPPPSAVAASAPEPVASPPATNGEPTMPPAGFSPPAKPVQPTPVALQTPPQPPAATQRDFDVDDGSTVEGDILAVTRSGVTPVKIAAAVVALAVVGGVVSLFVGGDDEPGAETASAPPGPDVNAGDDGKGPSPTRDEQPTPVDEVEVEDDEARRPTEPEPEPAPESKPDTAAKAAAVGRFDDITFAPKNPTRMSYTAAAEQCASLRAGGHSTWRMPRLAELNRLTKGKAVPYEKFWSGTEGDDWGNRALIWNAKKHRSVPLPRGWRGGFAVCVLE